MTARVLGLDHVSVLVADTDRALAFYRDVLGLSVDGARPDLGFPGAWLDLGAGQSVHLLELPNPDAAGVRPAHGGRDRHLALRVSNLEAFVGRLEACGLAYTRSRSGRASLFCRDPDGNAVELLERIL